MISEENEIINSNLSLNFCGNERFVIWNQITNDLGDCFVSLALVSSVCVVYFDHFANKVNEKTFRLFISH